MNTGNTHNPTHARSVAIDTLPGVHMDLSDQHAALSFETPYRAFSSAVLNGGAVWAHHFVNLKVAKDASSTEAPELSLQNYALALEHTGLTVGMMTAASLQSARWVCRTCQGVDYAVLLTSGLSNARRVGDSADVTTHSFSRHSNAYTPIPGTINIAVAVNAELSDAALLEIFMLATEAKVAAVMECHVHSPVSNKLATGTGTDSLAVFSSNHGPAVRYAGKHTLLGECIGATLVQALKDSIQDYQPAGVDNA